MRCCVCGSRAVYRIQDIDGNIIAFCEECMLRYLNDNAPRETTELCKLNNPCPRCEK